MSTKTARLQEERYVGGLKWSVWKRMFSFLSPYKRFMVGLVLVALLQAGLEAAFPLVTRGIIDQAVQNRIHAHLLPWILMYALLSIMLCAGTWAFIRLAAVISTNVSHDIRRAGFRKLQELPFSYYDRRSVGWLITRLTSDCDRLSRFIAWSGMDFIWGVAMLLGIGAVMLYLNWRLALIVMTIIPPMAWLSLIFQKRILATSRKVRRVNSNITASYSESIMGVRTTKTLVREEENLHEFSNLTNDMFASSVRNALLQSMYFPIVVSLGSVGTGLVLWRGGVEVMSALPSSMSIGTLLAFISYSGAFIGPIRELAMLLAESQNAQAAAERITGLLETTPEIKDSPEVIEAVERNTARGLPAGVAIDGREDKIETIEFRNVSFAYKQGKEVLKDFNLTVRSGQSIALVGPTGGGKTTIVSLLCRFYEPTSGQVLINGVDYRKRPLQWLQSNLGVVLQTPHLFDDTIYENIRYGNLQADDRQVEWAAKLVNAHDFIMNLENGYDTRIGEGGNKLSTGQKQLVCLARAVLADPQIFIMDEATSSVDTETEQLIQQGLMNVLKGRISFIIAHRLSTIRSADQILIIENGKIVERGAHAELIQLKGKYYDLYVNQFSQDRQRRIFAECSAQEQCPEA